MTPTQAQIEAAARIIFEYMSDIDGGEADWLDVREDCRAAAEQILALSTAAEVGIAYSEQWPVGTVAAEVGYGEIEALRNELEIQRASQISAIDQMLAAEQREAATIERCAQVAEWEGYATVGRQIAAEIRKLQEKP